MSTVDDLTPIGRGKVRDLYRTVDGNLLLVASDRISALDHILTPEIPDKGRILTAMTAWWFAQFPDVPNHLISVDDPRIPERFRGRAMLCTPLQMVPVEAVARGYLAGSGYRDYASTGTVCGIELPPGLRNGDKLPITLFTPAAKAEQGAHDENVSFDAVVAEVGELRAAELRDATLQIYNRAATIAEERGIILADTKFEFGLDGDTLVLADEVLTPDSSRFWPADDWQPGQDQPSYDKQFIRDWLVSPASGWDQHSDAPPPPLPDEIVAATRARYIEAYERLTGLQFSDWIA